MKKIPLIDPHKNHDSENRLAVLPCESKILNQSPLFLSKEELINYSEETYGLRFDFDKLERLIEFSILPVFVKNEKEVFLREDIDSIIAAAASFGKKEAHIPIYDKLFELDAIRIGKDTVIDFINKNTVDSPTFYSAIRNLIARHNITNEPTKKSPLDLAYFEGARITTYSEDVIDFANGQLIREEKTNMDSVSQFARSAYYMGSKRTLSGFLVEAIDSELPEDGIVVDLMCGSGVASGAFNKVWETFSSDALEFCTTLATVHGGGFSRDAAQKFVSKLIPVAKSHFNDLIKPLSHKVDYENDLFYRDINENLKSNYQTFVQEFPTFPNHANANYWDPQLEVRIRKKNNKTYPYCLFTTYFANVYFGLRQSIEIDSLRYSIDQLGSEIEKKWALGALIATLSALGTTYAAHFAQPYIRDYDGINDNKLANIIDKRSSSITHEFIVRFLNISEQSDTVQNKINIVKGPWQDALNCLSERLANKKVLVYLDAPYKREEYSRYYHVLETLIRYNYPTCTGAGLTPKPGERFKSNFFARSKSKITLEFIEIIGEIIRKKWICAWSYSDSGAADIQEVLQSVYDSSNCTIRTYSAPFTHKSQGGAKPKGVKEYLIMFIPR